MSSVTNKRIGIAMSGGVDSTATTLILQKDNHVEGFFMRLAQPDFDLQLDKVQRLADQIGIRLHVIDLRAAFKERVLDYFAQTYFRGKTPNPCMICNHQIKFGLFQDAVISHSLDYMATGHYARIVKDEQGFHLLDGVDPVKNQSYFLSRLNQLQLGRTLFPLGGKHKNKIFDFVKDRGFSQFEGVESQDICFLGNEDVGDYLESRHPEAVQQGTIISITGQELGKHKGLFRYTIGQRRGLGIPDSTPWYVTGIDAENNRLIVGKSDDLMSKQIEVTDLHWLLGLPPELGRTYTVRIRYSHRGSEAKIHLKQNGNALISFAEQQRAVTPGQFAVFYDGNEVLGSGIITEQVASQ